MEAWYPTRMEDEVPQVTEEHVRRAVEVVHRQLAQPYITRAQDRMRGIFMAACLWMLFFGWVLGEYIGSGAFPWGPLAVAIAYTALAVVMYRRNRD